MSIQLKTCYRCKSTYTLDNFYKSNKRKDGLQTRCKNCNYELQKEWLAKNKEKENQRQREYYHRNKKHLTLQNERYRVKKKYGITLEDVAYYKEKQKNKCAICNEYTKLVIDHCHKSNKFRGLLCGQCNKLLGCAKDNTTILENAIKYLKG